MSQKILIVHDPAHHPGNVPRMRFHAKYLSENGWEVTMCLSRLERFRFQHEGYRLDIFDHFCSPLSKTFWGKIRWFISFVLTLLFDYNNTWFRRRMEKLYANEHFDLVLCSTHTTFPLRASYEFARRRGIPFVAALRDIAAQTAANTYIQHKTYKPIANFVRMINVRKRNSVLRKADAVVSVSKWHVEQLLRINPRTYLIYNGFDPSKFYPSDVRDDKFRLFFAGRVYDKFIHDPRPLFCAIHNLDKQGTIDKSWFWLDFYVSENSRKRVISMTSKFNITSYCHFNSLVKPETVPDLARRASICLIFSNVSRPEGPHGIMTTKFFEHLGIEKPILCVKSDEGLLAEAIKDTNSGLSALHHEEIEQFILARIDEWRTNGYTHQPVNHEQRELFSRVRQGQQFIQIFEELTSH